MQDCWTEPVQWNLFSGMCCIFLFTLHWITLVQCDSQTWPRPLIVRKCFCFIWHLGPGLEWHPEGRTMSYLDSKVHGVVIFFPPTGNCFCNFLSSPVHQFNIPHLEAWLRCISVCVCMCINVGLHCDLWTRAAAFSLQPPTVIYPPWALAECLL